jgi:hypothetical protein
MNLKNQSHLAVADGSFCILFIWDDNLKLPNYPSKWMLITMCQLKP